MGSVPPEKPAASGRDRRELALKRIRPAYEQVAEQLRELVISGSIAPGERLPVEGALSAQFGVSRSTVREALKILAGSGVIEIVPHRL